MISACVPGQQISLDRMRVIQRAIEIILAKSEHIDWNEHDLLIQVVPNEGKTPEGA